MRATSVHCPQLCCSQKSLNKEASSSFAFRRYLPPWSSPALPAPPGAGHGRQARRQQQVWLQRGGGTPTAAPAREAPAAKGRRLGLGPPVCTRRLLLRPHSVASGSHPLPVSSRAPPSGPVCALVSQSRRIRAHSMTSIQLNTSGAAPLQTQSRSEVLAAKTSTCEFYRTRFSPHTCSGTPRSWQ